MTHPLLVLAARIFLQYLVRLCICALQAWPLNTIPGHWKKQRTFDLLLYLCRLYLDEAALLHLSKGNWPCLKKLDMCNNERPLSSKAISHLSDAKWPQLEWLCLTNNGFNQTSVLMELSKANWPLLKTLQVSNMLHAATTSCIALKSLLQSDLTLSSQYTCPGFCQSSSLLRSPIVTPCCSKLYDFRQASGIFIDCLSDSTQPVCLSCLLQRQNVKQLHTTCCPEDDHNHDAWLYLC